MCFKINYYLTIPNKQKPHKYRVHANIHTVHSVTCRCFQLDICEKHSQRVWNEHNYCKRQFNDPGSASESITHNQHQTRNLPLWLKRFGNIPQRFMLPMPEIAARDGVFAYATAVLTDGLMLKEFRDAIHEGDGNRVQRCYKFLMPYFLAQGITSMP